MPIGSTKASAVERASAEPVPGRYMILRDMYKNIMAVAGKRFINCTAIRQAYGEQAE